MAAHDIAVELEPGPEEKLARLAVNGWILTIEDRKRSVLFEKTVIVPSGCQSGFMLFMPWSLPGPENIVRFPVNDSHKVNIAEADQQIAGVELRECRRIFGRQGFDIVRMEDVGDTVSRSIPIECEFFGNYHGQTLLVRGCNHVVDQVDFFAKIARFLYRR